MKGHLIPCLVSLLSSFAVAPFVSTSLSAHVPFFETRKGLTLESAAKVIRVKKADVMLVFARNSDGDTRGTFYAVLGPEGRCVSGSDTHVEIAAGHDTSVVSFSPIEVLGKVYWYLFREDGWTSRQRSATVRLMALEERSFRAYFKFSIPRHGLIVLRVDETDQRIECRRVYDQDVLEVLNLNENLQERIRLPIPYKGGIIDSPVILENETAWTTANPSKPQGNRVPHAEFNLGDLVGAKVLRYSAAGEKEEIPLGTLNLVLSLMEKVLPESRPASAIAEIEFKHNRPGENVPLEQAVRDVARVKGFDRGIFSIRTEANAKAALALLRHQLLQRIKGNSRTLVIIRGFADDKYYVGKVERRSCDFAGHFKAAQNRVNYGKRLVLSWLAEVRVEEKVIGCDRNNPRRKAVEIEIRDT